MNINFIIDWCQVFRLTEHDIRGTFDLLNRPGITQPERFRNGTVASGKDIENFMEPLRVDTVRKFLSSFNIGDFKERIVLHPVRKLFFIKLIGEQVMTVHVKLKTERRPCRDTKIAKAKFPVDKIEIVMKTLALVKLQEGLLWSSIFVTLMANKIGGLQFGIYRNCQISSRVSHTAVAALPLTKANRSDFE